MKILVDADSCPKKAMMILVEMSDLYDVSLLVISSFNHQINGIEKIIVGNEPQATDIALINKTNRGDIVVTQDWGLASLVLSKGANCIGPKGYIYSKDKIDFMLEERHLKAQIRKVGGRTKGPSPREKEDDERFKKNLEILLKQLNELKN
ncbi:MAG: hypothetical protein APF76_10425 [Desulfitibacter sp. BRH_c19]|nr:MAG: hypothetical protein APF76_10425 [Desulfitibacter sp. BRH_c19]